jgi:hypothetical protein
VATTDEWTVGDETLIDGEPHTIYESVIGANTIVVQNLLNRDGILLAD